MSKPNLTELVQAAQDRVEDPHLRARIHRALDRTALVELANGSRSAETLPEQQASQYRTKIPLIVNALWERVRYSVSGCPLEDRGLDACFTCPDIQSAACALSNQELLDIKLPEPEKEEETMAENTVLSLEEWNEKVDEDAEAANKLLKAALMERHELSPTETFKEKRRRKKESGESLSTQALLVALDEEKGLFESEGKPAKKAGAAAKKTAGKTAGATAKKAGTAKATTEAVAVDLDPVYERLDALEAKIDKVLKLTAGMAIGLEAVELLADLDDEAVEEAIAPAFPPSDDD